MPKDKRIENCYFTLWLLGQGYHPTRVRLMVLGRWVRCFEFRRPLMNILQSSWPKHDVRVRGLLTYENRQELLQCIGLCPLAGTDLRAEVDWMVTCSDASEAGGGLCASGQLTEEGHSLLTQLRSPAFSGARLMPFSPLGAMQLPSEKGPRVFVVSLFDGISALMCALCRMEVQIVGFASSEVDKECKKLVRRRWPGVIELNDITKISDEMLEALASSTGYKVDFVLVGGGSPCQDLSALLSGGKGLAGERSKLFYCMPRIFQGLARVFPCPVYWFVENVFSMTKHNRAEFSTTLNVTPVMLDSKFVSWCRRPRLFWCNWDVAARGQEVLIAQDGYREWRLPGLQPEAGSWLDPLCRQGEDCLMPTLTRALPRKTPPREPAGLHSASPEAIARWQSDLHRFQVYQYEEKAMVLKPNGELRLPSLTERERLMGFDEGYVSAALGPKKTVNESFNIGASMIGNSFQVQVISLLVDELLASYDPNYKPRQLGRILKPAGKAPTGWCSKPNFCPGCVPDKDAGDLVHEYLRQADKGGSDVRLDLGIPFRVKAWPRAGIRAHLFHWRIIHGYKWRHAAHINVLELQAVVNGLQWRLRKVRKGSKRYLHLVDSQVVSAILGKGRSSSRRLQPALSKLWSLCLATGAYLCVGYVNTLDNPSGIPSRWGPTKDSAKKGKKLVQASRSSKTLSPPHSTSATFARPPGS